MPASMRVGSEGNEDAKNDVELEHAREPSAIGRRRDLRDVQRRRDSGDADANPADHAREDEHGNPIGKGAAERRDDVEHADAQQSFFAAEIVGRPAAEQSAQHGAIERRANGDPVQSGTQSPERLDFLFRAGNDHGVKAEQKSGQRRNDGPEKRVRPPIRSICSPTMAGFATEDTLVFRFIFRGLFSGRKRVRVCCLDYICPRRLHGVPVLRIYQ